MTNSEIINLKIGLIVPIFNVEKTIIKVLQSISQCISNDSFEILLIDNNSCDKTLLLINEYLKSDLELSSHITIIKHENNYGYGCSVKAGFEYFSTQNVSHVMILHGDYQVEPSWLIEKLLGSIKSDYATDIVFASRFKRESSIENYSIVRKLGNYFFNITTTFCSGSKMSDAGTAMIIIRNDILKQVPFITLSNSWQFHPQLNILLYAVPNINIKEIPMNWSDSDADSTVPLFRYGFILLKMLLLYWFKKTVLKKLPHESFPIENMPENRRFFISKTIEVS